MSLLYSVSKFAKEVYSGLFVKYAEVNAYVEYYDLKYAAR